MGDQEPTVDLSGLEADLKRQIKIIVDDFNEYLNMIEKAVELASDQVTHIRINLIEKTLGRASSYSLSDFFVDLLIATVTSPFAAVALRKVTNGFVQRVLNMRDTFLKKGKDGVYEIVRVEIKKFDISDVTGIKPAVKATHPLYKKFDTSDVPQILKSGNKNYDLWQVTPDIIEPATDAARQAAREIIKESRKPQFTHDTDPKVMFKDAVYSFSHKQRVTNITIWDKQVNRIDKHEFSEDQLKGLLELWKLPKITSSEDINELRRKYTKNFEALIWVLVCGGYKNMVRDLEMRPKSSKYSSTTQKDKWNVDPELVVYWLNNLIHPYGDGEKTFREHTEKLARDFLKSVGLPFSTEPLPFKHEKELEMVSRNHLSLKDPAQIHLKEYFKQLSENTEKLLADPAKILNKVR